MTYTEAFQLTGKSAAATVKQGAAIAWNLTKQGAAAVKVNAPVYATKATRVSYQAYLILTSRQAKQTYKMVWNFTLILLTIVYAVVVTILKWADQEAQITVGDIAVKSLAEELAVEPTDNEVESEPEVEVQAEPVSELPFDASAIEYELPETAEGVKVFIEIADRRELIKLAWGLVGTEYELVLPNKMKTDRLRRKLKEVLRLV